MALLDDFYSEDEFAEEVKRKPRTLKSWRDQRKGPPVTYIGNKPYYRKASAREWLLSLEGKGPRRSAA